MIWNAETGEKIHALTDMDLDQVFSASFNHDGTRIVTAAVTLRQ